jgi:hypothetical protein
MSFFTSKPVFLLVLGLSGPLAAFSQTGTPPQGIAGQANLQALTSKGADANVQIFDNRYQGVKGSPYFLDAFVPGTVEIKTGNAGKSEVFQGVRLKYDAFSNSLQAVMPTTKDTVVFSTTPVITFSLEVPTTGNALVFKRFQEAKALDQNLREAFFAVLQQSQDGKVALVKRIGKKKIDANFKGPYSSGQTYDEIIDEVQYYVVANGSMQKVKLNKKSIVEALPNQSEKLKAYIAGQKLAMASEADLVKVVSYYQSL